MDAFAIVKARLPARPFFPAPSPPEDRFILQIETSMFSIFYSFA